MERGPLLLLVLALVTTSLVGCLSGTDTRIEDVEGYPRYDATTGLYEFRWTVDGMGPIETAYAPGAVSTVTNLDDEPRDIELPSTALTIEADGDTKRFTRETAFTLEPGASRTFLAPPSATVLSIDAIATTRNLDPADTGHAGEGWNQIVSGENVWNLSAHQEANFPHREPGNPNYGASIEYFTTFFEDLGYEVEVDPYGTQDATLGGLLCAPARGTTYCPESLANVVATKPGTDPDAGIIFVAGGHFDMVNSTTHAAFDDTSGTVSTLELARVLAPYEFEHTLMFGLWGGEENGIVGSQFWVRTHPEEVERIETYFNLDVVGMSWPAPRTEPDPHIIAAGPDAPSEAGNGSTGDPVSQAMLNWTQALQRDWFGYPDTVNGTEVFIYEGVASGQAQGYAGVNAQSDHTPFISAGVPSYFIFNGDALDMPVQLHTESDTLNNMTKYAYFGKEANLDDPSWPSQAIHDEAKDLLARSWEATLFFPLYHAILVDLGVHDPPSVEA